jgi:hypothetical protein
MLEDGMHDLRACDSGKCSMIETAGGYSRGDGYPFNRSVNFQNRRVRSADIERNR